MSERAWPFRIQRESGVVTRGYEIICAKCRDADMVPKGECGPTHPPIAKKFQRAGWEVGATESGDVCPACQTKWQRKNAMKTTGSTTPLPPPPPPAQITTAGTPTPGASARITDVYMALEDAYDRSARDYRPGWTDERIARELGVSVELVAKRRAADFGPVKVDTFADDLDDAVKGLGSEIASMRRFSDDLAAKITALETRQTVLEGLAGKARAR